VTLTKIPPGQPLTPTQINGLRLVSLLGGSNRDVVLAIDVTESVGLNDQGRVSLRQIVEDSLKAGDSVYIVPFAEDAGSLSVENPLGTPIHFSNKNSENIDRVLAKIPSNDPKRHGTDIQRAELTIYQGIAQINQNRLWENQPIKSQSVVWVTDAPLLTQPGITSQIWLETPANSPFRIAQSAESQERQKWIKILPLKERSLTIKNRNNKDYQIAIVDINPRVQEICTPVPGGQETCLVNPYLLKQLWLPSLVILLIVLAGIWSLVKFIRLQKKWEITFKIVANGEDEEKIYIPNNRKIAVGQNDHSCKYYIDCPGGELQAYLERRGESLYLIPNKDAKIEVNGKLIRSRILISNLKFTLSFPDKYQREQEIFIKIKK